MRKSCKNIVSPWNKTMGYCIRVQAHEGYGEKIKSMTFCQDYSSIIAVKHTGKKSSNPHYHLVVKTDVKDQAFRVRLRKIFDQGKGNQHMSLKSWDMSIDAISYLFHEDPDGIPLVCKGFEVEFIDAARKRNKEVLEKVNEAKEKASHKLEDIVFEKFKGKAQRFVTEIDIAKEILLTAWRSDKYAPNDWLLKSMTMRIKFRLCDGNIDQEEELALTLAQKVFKGYTF